MADLAPNPELNLETVRTSEEITVRCLAESLQPLCAVADDHPTAHV